MGRRGCGGRGVLEERIAEGRWGEEKEEEREVDVSSRPRGDQGVGGIDSS